MARCLHPITVRNPGVFGLRELKSLPSRGVLNRYGRDNLRPMLSETITVPCGKCLACMKNKQSSMVVRCLREAEKRGSFGFMTLTYDDDHLPLVESMWRVDLKNGIEQQVEPPEFVSTGYHPEPQYLHLFSDLPGTDKPRYRSFVHCNILQYQWQIRITPSVCRSDVRNWLKQARIQYERDNGEKLPDFSYVAISEYGPRTCRPHYHLAFFGLQRCHLEYLLDRWRFGKIKQFRMVPCINKDKSSGYVRASKYIGKYMQKGEFECLSVKCGDSERPRVCQSMHFGTEDLEPLRRQVLAFDMYGEYDPYSLCRLDGSRLSSDEVEKLVSEVSNRLYYPVPGKGKDLKLPIPRIIRDRIFKVILISDKNGKYRRVLSASEVYDRKKWKKEAEIPSSLWVMVASALRDNADRDLAEEFESFHSLHLERTYTQDYAEFAYWKAFCSELEGSLMQKDFQSFYGRSHL